MTRRMGKRVSVAYDDAEGTRFNISRLVVVVSCVAAIGALARGLWGAGLPAETLPEPTLPSDAVVAAPAATSSSSAASTSLEESPPSPVPTIGVPHIGIVAGHWGSDEGAFCPDGLTEVEINLDIARRVVRILRDHGCQADLLEEYDSRLEGYLADALVSIHADSCEPFPNATPPASGFKVASVEDSFVPEKERRLVACIAERYADRTGMYFHANSITYDMTRYHSFYEIDGRTPGAIIETGFMRLDREMLTQRPDLVAQGIVDGVVCFVEGETP